MIQATFEILVYQNPLTTSTKTLCEYTTHIPKKKRKKNENKTICY